MYSEHIKRFVNENFDDLIFLLEQLCKIPAPSLREEKRAEFCKAWLNHIGAQNIYIDEALNVIFPINCENKDKITAICAHTDTVFPDTEPMSYFDDGEKIHCPAVGDDTASVAVLLFTAKYIIENNITPENGLLIVLNSGEEGLGNLKGTRQLFKDFSGRIARFISLDSNIDKIADKCVGSSRYRVTVETKGGHSYLDFGNANAIHILSEMISRIYEIQIPNDGDSKTTVNVGEIVGGTSVNTIAQTAQMLCEYRSDDAAQLEKMKFDFLNIFNSFNEIGANVSVEVVGERPCAQNVDQNEIDRMKFILTDIVKNALGKAPIFRSSSTDCNIPLSLGVPAICVGVYNGDGQHTREEWLEKESLRAGLEIGIRAILCLGV